MKFTTTLAIIRTHEPCTSGWEKLLKHLGPKFPKDQPIDFATILESNGFDDALWALRAVMPNQEKDRDRLARLFACDCAESVLHIYEKQYPGDPRPREAVRVARRFAVGEATQDERAAARDAAWAAAWAAAGAAARDAARAAARAAAWAAARDAAGAPAWDAAWAAAGAPAWDAAWAAAWAAAGAAAWAAARDAAGTAAGTAAGAAARAAERTAFKSNYVLYFCTAHKDGGKA